ncbi:hypothetical protein, partial [Yersinia rohdei]|uniref:hypothetical protein n=1 Tax=Yersinia rohdei TaxID=29485 RepID=UPI0025AAAC24
SPTTCRLRVLRAGRTQTDFARDALLNVKLAATALCHSGIAQCSNSSPTTCRLRVLRAGRTQTDFARDALLSVKLAATALCHSGIAQCFAISYSR